MKYLSLKDRDFNNMHEYDLDVLYYNPYIRVFIARCAENNRYIEVRLREIEDVEVVGGYAATLAKHHPWCRVSLGVGDREDGKGPDLDSKCSVSLASTRVPHISPVPGTCLRDALALIGIESQLPAHCEFKASIHSLRVRDVFFLAPRSFKWPDLKLTQPNNFLDQLIENVRDGERYILRVHLKSNKTSKHCVAIRGRYIADPEKAGHFIHGQWLPLRLSSFEYLDIDRVVGMYKLRE